MSYNKFEGIAAGMRNIYELLTVNQSNVKAMENRLESVEAKLNEMGEKRSGAFEGRLD